MHNHLRQGSLHLEDSVGTNDWWFQCFCTVLGIIEVDVYTAYCSFNQHSLTLSHKKFLDSLVMQLLSNNRQGAPVQTAYTTSSQKRSIESVDEEKDLEVECSSETHDVLPLSQYIAEVRQQGLMSKHQRMHGSAARCRVCPKPAPDANYARMKSSNSQWNKPFAISGPKSSRACIQIHQLNQPL